MTPVFCLAPSPPSQPPAPTPPTPPTPLGAKFKWKASFYDLRTFSCIDRPRPASPLANGRNCFPTPGCPFHPSVPASVPTLEISFIHASCPFGCTLFLNTCCRCVCRGYGASAPICHGWPYFSKRLLAGRICDPS